MDPVLVIAMVSIAVASYLLGRISGAARARHELDASRFAGPVLGPPIPRPTEVVEPGYRERIGRALAAGNKIEAIKLYREATGLGLKESKDAIEAWVATGGEEIEPDGWPQLPQPR